MYLAVAELAEMLVTAITEFGCRRLLALLAEVIKGWLMIIDKFIADTGYTKMDVALAAETDCL